MKLFKKKLVINQWKVGWQEIILILVLLALSVPTLFIEWSLLDDGITIIVSKKIAYSLSHFDFSPMLNAIIEKTAGRFRPFYWIFNWLIYEFSGTNVHLFFIIHSLILISTALLLYKLISGVGSNKTGAPPFGAINCSLVVFFMENIGR